MEHDILNTPIKNISKLSIRSPNLKQIMLDKGYSNKISETVLEEMNKIIDIDDYSPSKSPPCQTFNNHYNNYNNFNIHFNELHANNFAKMESIRNHYTVSSYQKKKRRTLTGIEESPILQVNSAKPKLSNLPSKTSPSKLSPSKISPTRSKLSPSKKSFNLNEILNRKISYPKPKTPSPVKENKENDGFVKPLPMNRDKYNYNSRPSLQRKSSIPTLQRKSSIPTLNNENTKLPTLQHKSSIPTLQHKSSIPTLQRKSSIPSLQHKSSIPSLQHKSSIPTLQHKSSIPTLQHKSSIPTLQKKPSIPTLQKKNSTCNLTKLSSLLSSLTSFPNSYSKSNPIFLKPKASVLPPVVTQERFLKRKSSAQSLHSYDKPTLSSIQKSRY